MCPITAFVAGFTDSTMAPEPFHLPLNTPLLGVPAGARFSCLNSPAKLDLLLEVAVLKNRRRSIF